MNLFILLLVPTLIVVGVITIVTLIKLAFVYLIIDLLGLTDNLTTLDTICLVLFITIIYKLSTK